MFLKRNKRYFNCKILFHKFVAGGQGFLITRHLNPASDRACTAQHSAPPKPGEILILRVNDNIGRNPCCDGQKWLFRYMDQGFVLRKAK